MKVGDLVNVGDLVKCTMLTDQNVGIVVRAGFHSAQVHFATPPEESANLRWFSVLYLEVINKS